MFHKLSVRSVVQTFIIAAAVAVPMNNIPDGFQEFLYALARGVFEFLGSLVFLTDHIVVSWACLFFSALAVHCEWLDGKKESIHTPVLPKDCCKQTPR
jgi:hypothetical protein